MLQPWPHCLSGCCCSLPQPIQLDAAALAAVAAALPPPLLPAEAPRVHTLLHSLLRLCAVAAANAAACSTTATITATTVGTQAVPAALAADVHQLAQRVLCPTTTGSASSWALEAAALQALSAVAVGGTSGAIALRDSWLLQGAAATLQMLVSNGMPSALATDHLLAAYMQAMARLTAVLRVRPQSVAAFIADAANDAGSLANVAADLLPRAVAGIKALSGSALLPAALLVPLSRACVELALVTARSAADCSSTDSAGRIIAALLLTHDGQLQVHIAAALVQACASNSQRADVDTSSPKPPKGECVAGDDGASGSGSHSGTRNSDGASTTNADAASGECTLLSEPLWLQQVVLAAGRQVLSLEAATAESMLLAYQALADVAVDAVRLRGMAGVDLARGVAALAAEQLIAAVAPLSLPDGEPGCDAATGSTLRDERCLLLVLLLARLCAAAAAAAAAAATAPCDERPLLPPALLNGLVSALLQLLQHQLPVLQHAEGIDRASGARLEPGHRVTTVGGRTPLPGGGWQGFLQTLPPTALLRRWGLTQPDCAALMLLGASGVGDSAAVQHERVSWLLDPGLGGAASGSLAQSLPLQLTAAAVDLAHSLLAHGLQGAVGSSLPPALPGAGPPPPPPPQGTGGQRAALPCATPDVVGSWGLALFSALDLRSLRPVKHLAKSLLTQLAGSSSAYKQHRALHHLRRHADALLCALLPTAVAAGEGLQQQQQQQHSSCGGAGTPAVLETAAHAAMALQQDWSLQCLCSHLLQHIQTIAEAQPLCWAHACAMAPPELLPLLFSIGLVCTAPQLCFVSVRLVGIAVGAVAKAAGAASSSARCSDQANAQPPPLLDVTWLCSGSSSDNNSNSGSALLLRAFVQRCVLGWPEASERRDAAKLLLLVHKALNCHRQEAACSALVCAVLGALPAAAAVAGSAATQLFAAAAQLLRIMQPAGSGVITQALAAASVQLLNVCTSAVAALAAHPYAPAAVQLRRAAELQLLPPTAAGAHFLEVSFAAASAAAQRPVQNSLSSSSVRLGSLAQQLKYSERQVNGHMHAPHHHQITVVPSMTAQPAVRAQLRRRHSLWAVAAAAAAAAPPCTCT